VSICREILRNGGRYWDLYTENVEASVWYFARDKMKALYNVRNPYVGDRGKTVLRSYNFTERDIQNLDHDLKLVNPSRFESAKMWASSRPITTGSLISFIIAFIFFCFRCFYWIELSNIFKFVFAFHIIRDMFGCIFVFGSVGLATVCGRDDLGKSASNRHRRSPHATGPRSGGNGHPRLFLKRTPVL